MINPPNPLNEEEVGFLSGVLGTTSAGDDVALEETEEGNDDGCEASLLSGFGGVEAEELVDADLLESGLSGGLPEGGISFVSFASMGF